RDGRTCLLYPRPEHGRAGVPLRPATSNPSARHDQAVDRPRTSVVRLVGARGLASRGLEHPTDPVPGWSESGPPVRDGDPGCHDKEKREEALLREGVPQGRRGTNISSPPGAVEKG